MKNILSIILALSLSVGAFAQLDRSVRPKAGPAPEIKLGKIESFTLSNGLKVFVVENHKLPKVSFSLSLNVDPVIEGDMAGYLDATGELLATGTTSRSKDELNKEIDYIGARLSTSSNGVYISGLTKHSDKLINILSDVATNANFKQEELDKIVTQLESSIKQEKDSPDAIASNVRSVLNYGKNHPYGEVANEETIKNISLDKCTEYYKKYFKPNVAYLAIVGDVTVAEVKPLIEKYFSKWEKAEVPVNKYKTPLAPKQTRVAVVNKVGAVQSVINITYPINLKPNSPDVIKSKIMNAILGGGSTARLFMNLREKHGYTYGAYSSISQDELVGSFTASAKVRNEVTDSAITQFKVELERMVKEKVTEEELQAVKNYMTGTFAYTLQDPQTIARFAINIDKYNLPEDYYSTYLQKVAAVTVDDVFAMAKKYIKPDNATILVVGNKDEISDKLSSFTSTEVEYYDAFGNDYVEALKPAPENITVNTILDGYIKSKYGMEKGKKLTKKLKKIKSITTTMNASIQGQSISLVSYKKYPNKTATVISMGPMVIQKKVFDGTNGSESGMQGNKKIEGEELKELALEAKMHSDTKYEELGYKFNLLGMEEIDGKNTYKLEKITPSGKTESVWHDANTYLPVKSYSVQENDQVGTIVVESKFSDYKEVNGVKFAHKIIQAFGPQTLDMEVQSIEVNGKIDDEIFSVE